MELMTFQTNHILKLVNTLLPNKNYTQRGWWKIYNFTTNDHLLYCILFFCKKILSCIIINSQAPVV